MNAFFNSQFSHCLFLWMFYRIGINIKVNNLHYWVMYLVYQDYNSSFEELLLNDNSVTIHQRNLQSLAIKMFKVKCGIEPMFMCEIFSLTKNLSTDNTSANTRSWSLFYNADNPKKLSTGLITVRCRT